LIVLAFEIVARHQGKEDMTSPPNFKLSTVSHLMLGVTDLAASLEFYRDKLGLDLAFESPGFAFVNGSGITLCLNEPMSKLDGELVGATEIVFGVDDVDQAHEALSAIGVEFTHEPRQITPDQWAANFTDPDGHRLSVLGARPKTPEG
jgi:catechol 2,3-dioxygenase-like lactoylglutathione lyase family enzyme